MRAAKRWLLWRAEENPGKPKPKKVPYYAGGGRREGKLDTPEDWARLVSYEEAKERMKEVPPAYSGLAFALGPDGTGNCWQGIDLDNVSTNRLSDLANAAPGLVERSPSREGCHAVGYGRPFDSLGSNGSGVEASAGGRYYTVTEETIRDAPLQCLADFVDRDLRPRHGSRASNVSVHGPTEPRVLITAELVSDLRSALMHLRADDRDQWIAVGHALHELGDVGRGLWLDWSATSSLHRPGPDAKTWDTFEPIHTGYAAVFKHAQAAGWINPRSKSSQLLPVQWPAVFTPTCTILLDDDLLRMPQAQSIVKGIVPREGIGAMYGPSGTFKSFLILDLLAGVSNGAPWFGCRTVARPTVYVPFEGRSGVPNRIRAWRATRPPGTTSNIAFIYDDLNLRVPADRERLIKTLIDGGWAGGVLCIDTLAQAGPGIDENSSEGMGEMIAIFNGLQRRLGGVVLVVHHTGKDASRGLRGWSGLLGALDFAIECEELSDKEKAHARLIGKMPGRFRLAKVKDGEAGRSFDFEMHRVSLYDDQDGDEVTSLVVQPKAKPKPAPSQEAAAVNAADDEFIWQWTNKLQTQGKRPSERALKAEREVMKPQRAFTEKRIAEAIARLKTAGRIVSVMISGNSYLRAVELTSTPVGAQTSSVEPDV